MNRRPKVEDTEPWYRQFWPWFLIAIPMMSVVVGITMLALAVKERRELDREERAELDRLGEQMWAALPGRYQWLKDWEYV